MSEYRDKLLSLGFSMRRGSSETRIVIDERDGTPAGSVTEHWNDSSDATGIVKPVRVKARRRDPR